MVEGRNWPQRVFLESTSLFQQGSKLQKPEFAKLLELRDLLKFDLMVSEVSWAEYVRQREDKLDELARDIKSVDVRLGDWNQDTKNIKASLAQLAELKKTIRDVYDKKAKESGIQILGIPAINVYRLFHMAIDRVPPFEQSKDDKTEKGFRDALIMFTILATIEGRPEDHSLVITQDALLTKGLKHHEDEFKTVVTTASNLDEANAHIEARVNEWYRKYLVKESDEAKAELAKYEKDISDQVKAIRELTDFDLGTGPFFFALGSKKLEVGESIQRVNGLKVDGVDSAVWRDKNKDESRILFRVRCSATVVTSVSPTLPFFSPTKYPIGGEKLSTFLNFATPTRQEQERTIPMSLYGEAKLKRTEGGWKLSSMKVDTSQPSTEEMAALSLT